MLLFLVQDTDLLDCSLKLLDQGFLCIGTLLGLISYHLNFSSCLSMLLILRLEVLGKRLEGFSARCFDLERLEFLKRMAFVHSFDNCVDVTHHFFFQNVSVMR